MAKENMFDYLLPASYNKHNNVGRAEAKAIRLNTTRANSYLALIAALIAIAAVGLNAAKYFLGSFRGFSTPTIIKFACLGAGALFGIIRCIVGLKGKSRGAVVFFSYLTYLAFAAAAGYLLYADYTGAVLWNAGTVSVAIVAIFFLPLIQFEASGNAFLGLILGPGAILGLASYFRFFTESSTASRYSYIVLAAVGAAILYLVIHALVYRGEAFRFMTLKAPKKVYRLTLGDRHLCPHCGARIEDKK